MKDIDKKAAEGETEKSPAPVVDETTPAPTFEAPPAPTQTGMTEESVKQICEEVIGAFLDRFTPEKTVVEETKKVEDDESFDY